MAPKFYDPRQPVEVTRNHLPHWSQQATTYFVTFRSADSLPGEKLRRHVEARRRFEQAQGPRPWSPEIERDYHRRFSGTVERWLDAGSGDCPLRDPGNARIVEDTLLFFDGQRYRLHAWVVMPNHVHVLFETRDEQTPSTLLQSWKGFSAREINQLRGRSGPLWQRSYFDRMIRNWPHFGRCVRYILRNPRKAGLSDKHCRMGTSRVADQFRTG